jgi:Uma2 family endonuclease
LKQYLVREPVGQVVTEVGFKLASQPDTLRGPDVAFVRRDRFPSPASRGFFEGHPDVAIEVCSPDDRPSEMREKVWEYLSAGTSVVVVVEPDDRTVTCHRPQTLSVTLTPDDRLDLGDVIPGFTCPVSQIFE